MQVIRTVVKDDLTLYCFTGQGDFRECDEKTLRQIYLGSSLLTMLCGQHASGELETRRKLTLS